MTPEDRLVLEMFGEGKTDVGVGAEPGPPTSGVVPILVYKLCGKPKQMVVKRKRIPFLQEPELKKSKRLWRKIEFAKRRAAASGSAGVVFVVHSEGGRKEHRKLKGDLEKGRESVRPDFPMAIGVAQPCIESWLLADAPAIRRAMDLPTTPEVPGKPEELPAPHQDRMHNPKTELAKATGTTKKEVSVKEKDGIATAINDLNALRTRCPLGFAPFADEVDQRIRPLF